MIPWFNVTIDDTLCNEAREARSAEPFFFVFPGEKASSYRIAYEGRVPQNIFSVGV